MTQNGNHDLKYPHVRVGTLVSMRIIDILTKTDNHCPRAAFKNTKKTHSAIKFNKELK